MHVPGGHTASPFCGFWQLSAGLGLLLPLLNAAADCGLLLLLLLLLLPALVGSALRVTNRCCCGCCSFPAAGRSGVGNSSPFFFPGFAGVLAGLEGCVAEVRLLFGGMRRGGVTGLRGYEEGYFGCCCGILTRGVTTS
ncbi:uncharacterized protein B0H64DRAFT_160071 [Chaetomium fimeti]|uniref:Uncharacterized protein n=1 Tax=Chaetomium fimeti TaxID=1854472 RepID=A0AAE0LSS8_9PEZI|nr:hypothetical protein B0H64DRAFT_160071 [Chaetomium fimeti]